MGKSPVITSVDGLAAMSPWLWWLSVAFYGFGDLLTTATTELSDPIAEGSPVVGFVVQSHGLLGLILLKLAVFGGSYVVWRAINHPHNIGVPLALSVLGIGLTTWNMVVLGFTWAG